MGSYAEFNNIVMGSTETAGLLAKLEYPGSQEITDSEKVQIRHLVYRLMNAWYIMQTSYASNQLSSADFEMYKDDIRVLTETYPGLLPVATEILSQYKGMLDLEIHEPFAEYAKRNG